MARLQFTLWHSKTHTLIIEEFGASTAGTELNWIELYKLEQNPVKKGTKVGKKYLFREAFTF